METRLRDQNLFGWDRQSEPGDTHWIYLPLIQSPEKINQRINAPFFAGDILFSETGIFWFGLVNPSDNYADVRVGYNPSELFVNITAFDRRLWFNKTPSTSDIREWDAVALLLNLEGDTGNAPGQRSFQLIGQLNGGGARENWQAGYRGNGTTWLKAPLDFSTVSGWRGNSLNDDGDDRGWTMAFHVPFSSLGLSGPPTEGVTWGLSLVLHDRDDAAGAPISDKSWPLRTDMNRPTTWGQLVFGLPAFSPPSATPAGIVTIREGLAGTRVPDAHVGGGFVCGQPYGPDYFSRWGDANYAGYQQVNIQNQFDVADWPCFSKYYVTFPLEDIPKGKVILSSILRMFLFGNSGQGLEPAPQPSLIQVSTLREGWEESTITWNNAPLPVENVSRTWVNPVENLPGYPGIPYEWNVSRAAADAYEAGEPLRLVLYSADGAYNSGKYFFSSDTGEWNAEGRPTLEVRWGEP